MANLYYITKEKILSKNYSKLETWKTSSRPLLCFKRSRHNLYWKMKFLKQTTYIRYVTTKVSKFIQINIQASSDSVFTENSLKIKKGLEQVSRSHFSYNFLIKMFLLQYYINWSNFITRQFLLPKLFSEICFVFNEWAFDDVTNFEYVKS